MQAHALEATAIPTSRGPGILAPLLLAEADDAEPPQPLALIGLQFSKCFEGQGVFEGVVTAHDASCGYRIEYEDGDEEDLTLEELLNLPLSDPHTLVGRKLSKHFPGHGRFDGVVASYSEEMLKGIPVGFHVRYADDDTEHMFASELLRLLQPEKTVKRRAQQQQKPPAKRSSRPSPQDAGGSGADHDTAAEALPQLPLSDPHVLVGRALTKEFPGHGWYSGTVVSYAKETGFLVEYEDGDTEDLSPAKLLRLLQQKSEYDQLNKRRKAAPTDCNA